MIECSGAVSGGQDSAKLENIGSSHGYNTVLEGEPIDSSEAAFVDGGFAQSEPRLT
jgi:hypothetical protein